jgi:hypothetical protein
MSLGTFGGLTAFFAKDLLPSLYLGTAVDLTMGGQGGFGWGLSLDLGATWLAGDLGVFKDTRFGLSILDMGKGYSTPGATGMFGGAASSYPSAFTLGLGARSNLVQNYYWNLDAGLDIWSPSFQDLGIDISFGLAFREMIALRLGWSAGLRDIVNGTGRSYLPSLGIFGTISLDKGFRSEVEAIRTRASASERRSPALRLLVCDERRRLLELRPQGQDGAGHQGGAAGAVSRHCLYFPGRGRAAG